MATLVRIDRNGTKYYEGLVPCDRCGGAGGADKWQFTGYTCYKCGGTGKMQGKYKVYTPEYEAKLNARRMAKAEKWQKEHAEEIARAEAERIAKEEAEKEAARIAKEEEEARKAISRYIGDIGAKLDVTVTLEKIRWFDVTAYCGFGTERKFVYTFRDDAGNAIVWKTSKGINFEENETLHIVGTIKEHSEYDNEKQTVLTRCKVKEIAK